MLLKEHATEALDVLVHVVAANRANVAGELIRARQGRQLIKVGINDAADQKAAEIEPNSVVASASECAELPGAFKIYIVATQEGRHEPHPSSR